MATVPTQIDLFLAARREAILAPTKFDRAIIDVDGSDVNVVFNAAAAMGEEVTRYLQVALNETSLGTAKGEALTRWAYDRYQLPKKEATSAVVELRLQRAGSTGFTVAAGSIFGTATGETFATVTDVAFPSNSLGPYLVKAISQRTGTGGNVSVGTIVKVVSTFSDSTLTVTNLEAAAGGRDEETEDEFKIRVRDFFITARRGTREAIEFGALAVDEVAQASAAEITNPDGDATYRVQLYVSDIAGQANTILATEVEESLDEYRALGVPVSVVPAVPQYVTIVASGLQFEAGANTAAVLSSAADALVALVNGLAPNITLRKADILKTLTDIDLLIVPDGSLTEPAGDLVPTTGTVLRTTRDRIELNG